MTIFYIGSAAIYNFFTILCSMFFSYLAILKIMNNFPMQPILIYSMLFILIFQYRMNIDTQFNFIRTTYKSYVNKNKFPILCYLHYFKYVESCFIILMYEPPTSKYLLLHNLESVRILDLF